MDRTEIYNLIATFFEEQFEIPKEKIKPDANLFKDLDMDSIDALDMVGMLEAQIDIDVDVDELTNIRTVRDVVNFVSSKIGIPA
ncbi:MAG: acyl carrier protein [Deltaproteobacteria bacterium]|nr:acyl carrier protein [Deltaproteobacteria bacterium]